MMDVKIPVCRLCLEVVYSDSFEPLRKFINNIRYVLPTLNLNINNNPVICCKCKEALQKSFYFKSMCLETEKYLQNLQLNEGSVLNLEVLYNNEDMKTEKIIKGRICRFCLQITEDKLYSELYIIENMIEKCFLEVDLALSYNPIICNLCLDELQNQFALTVSCVDIEDRIKNYCVMNRTESFDQVSLHDILTFSVKKELYEDVHNSTFNGLVNVTKEVENDYGFTKLNKDIEDDEITKYVTHDRQEDNSEPPYRTTERILLQNGHYELYICKKCPYEARRKDIIEKHITLHEKPVNRPIHTCSECHYQTTRITDFRKHKLIHKTPDEVQMHKCKHCTFQAKQKSNLRTHMLIHKNPAEIKMYKCTQCSYQTKYTTGIKKHMNNVHRNPNEIMMHNCPFDGCSYQTKQKCHINQHIFHCHNVNITWYKCNQCPYKARQKSQLVTHMISHKEPNKLATHKCQKCNYTAKVPKYLQKHMLKHEKK